MLEIASALISLWLSLVGAAIAWAIVAGVRAVVGENLGKGLADVDGGAA